MRIKEFRHALPLALNEKFARLKIQKFSTDIAVPWKHFRKMLTVYRDPLEKSALEYVLFGHVGDGHVHVNVFPRDEQEQVSTRNIFKDFCAEAIRLGGTVSAEHGIGKIKREYLEMMFGADAIRQMAALKRQLDTNGIFNLDNMFAKEYMAHG